ncbi:hypothetical protein DFJ74DRAFT_646283 [Hyaloraphidium curvatum]|nr:hypothetical protein DFJ74DRAFT_646283 [Hyaloraphidium curvatum]
MSAPLLAPAPPGPAVVTLNDLLFYVLAFFLPPVAVWAKRGCCSTCCGCCACCGAPGLEEGRLDDGRRVYLRRNGTSWDLCLNLLLCLLGWIPAQIHAMFVVYWNREQLLYPAEFHAPFYRPYAVYTYSAIPPPGGAWPAPAPAHGIPPPVPQQPRPQPQPEPFPQPAYAGYPGNVSGGPPSAPAKDAKVKPDEQGPAQPPDEERPPPYNPEY